MGEENPKNRGELVFGTLKWEILDLRLKPGQMTDENDICDRSDMSRAPVRDALRFLREQGFVKAVPYRETYIILSGPDNIKQMIYMRIAVETMASGDFTQARTPMVMEDIRHAVTQQKALTQEPGFESERFYHTNTQMHSIWFWAVKRQRFWEMPQAQQLHYTRFHMLDFIAETDFEHIIEEHEESFQLISQGDGKGLEGSLKEHLYYSMKRMRHSIEAGYKDYFEEEPREGWSVT